MPATHATTKPTQRRAFNPGLILLPSIAFILSFFMTWATVGFGPDFLARWGGSFITTVIVLPLVLMSLGPIEALVTKVVGDIHWVARKLLVALISACVFESVIGLAVTAVGHAFDAGFAHYWWLAVSRSLPAGIVIGVFMTFYMKPRMERMRQAALARAA